MTIEEFEQLYRVRLVRKDRSRLMRAIAVVLWPLGIDFKRFWTTLRLPLGESTIYYPAHVADPMADRCVTVVRHELVHVAQQRTAAGLARSYLLYLLFPLPVLFSGRWFIERRAFLVDIEDGARTPTQCADLLWRQYFYPWPRRLMVEWFRANS